MIGFPALPVQAAALRGRQVRRASTAAWTLDSRGRASHHAVTVRHSRPLGGCPRSTTVAARVEWQSTPSASANAEPNIATTALSRSDFVTGDSTVRAMPRTRRATKRRQAPPTTLAVARPAVLTDLLSIESESGAYGPASRRARTRTQTSPPRRESRASPAIRIVLSSRTTPPCGVRSTAPPAI
eukprot:scaffold77479_cov72-Phaeocystis_antarctica.AAC.2